MVNLLSAVSCWMADYLLKNMKCHIQFVYSCESLGLTVQNLGTAESASEPLQRFKKSKRKSNLKTCWHLFSGSKYAWISEYIHNNKLLAVLNTTFLIMISFVSKVSMCWYSQVFHHPGGCISSSFFAWLGFTCFESSELSHSCKVTSDLIELVEARKIN